MALLIFLLATRRDLTLILTGTDKNTDSTSRSLMLGVGDEWLLMMATDEDHEAKDRAGASLNSQSGYSVKYQSAFTRTSPGGRLMIEAPCPSSIEPGAKKTFATSRQARKAGEAHKQAVRALHNHFLLIFTGEKPDEYYKRMAELQLEKNGPLSFLYNNAVSTAISDTYTSFSDRRAALGLSNPGTVESITREVQRDVFLTNYTFSGLRADLTKALSISPLFQLSHALSLGSPGLPPYQLGVLYGSNRVSTADCFNTDRQNSLLIILRCSCKATSTTTRLYLAGSIGAGALLSSPKPISRSAQDPAKLCSKSTTNTRERTSLPQ